MIAWEPRLRRWQAVARIELLYLIHDRPTLAIVVLVPALQILLFGYDESFMGAQAGGAPAGIENLLNLGRAGIEAGFAVERIAGIEAVKIVDREGLIGGFDAEAQITPGAPPKSFEAAVSAAIGDEDVASADELLAFDFVAIAFIAEAGEKERFGQSA